MKHVKSDEKKRLLNQAVRSELHTRYRQFKTLLQSNPQKAKQYAALLISKFDKAAARGMIKPGRADDKKARIVKFLSQVPS